MSIGNILMAGAIALVYVFWGILGNSLKVKGGWMAVIVTTAMWPVIILLSSFFKETVLGPCPSLRAVAYLAIAGMVNGAAVFLFSLKMADVNVPAGTFCVLVTIGMTVIVPFLDWGFNGRVFTTPQWVGLALAVVSIYLLSLSKGV